MEIDRRAFIASLGGSAAVALMTSEEKADALEHYMEERLDELVLTQQQGSNPPSYPTMAEIAAADAKRTGVRRGAGNIFNATGRDGQARGPLPAMSDRPTLLEFFEKRFAPANHVLQSATRALKTGMPEEIILACLDAPAAVGEMAEGLGISASLASHHLRLLRAARLLQAERRGRQVFYVVGDEHIRSMLADMVEHVGEEDTGEVDA